MPKQKTHKGAKKRITLTGKGKLRRGAVGGGHLLEKKSQARKRNYSKKIVIGSTKQEKTIRLMLGKMK